MWYGNGDQTFTELAGGLDVGGHEMTHGVIEQTANLEYQYESGALNESFADVFAVCIDRGDFKIGEDVVRPLTTTDGCLRNMQFPNSSTPSQPKHVSEQYFGTQDNGGVHINSGIPTAPSTSLPANGGWARKSGKSILQSPARLPGQVQPVYRLPPGRHSSRH
jgi:Zn-dependent metalloprotease